MPWLLAAVGALAVGGIFAYGIGVPRERPGGWRGAVLRWGHAAAWLFLAASFAAIAAGLGNVPGLLSLLALGCYIGFLAALVSLRRDRMGG